MQKIILSMTTIPSRKRRFKENIESILNQTYKYDKFVINVQHEEDLQWYKEFESLDNRIEINLCEEKWRSCNKLIPTLEKYPNDIIISIDDDIYYPNKSIETIVEKHNEFPDCIIAQEVNPLIVDKENKYISYINGFDIKLEQTGYGKYLSNCVLFPNGCFDNTSLFDFDKMMHYTNGTHDELWFWLNSTLNKVKVIGLKYVFSFAYHIKSPWERDEFRLGNLNCYPNSINEYMNKINSDYGEKLFKIITTGIPKFFINKDNAQLFIILKDKINKLYDYGFTVEFDENLDLSWKMLINTTYKLKKTFYN